MTKPTQTQLELARKIQDDADIYNSVGALNIERVAQLIAAYEAEKYGPVVGVWKLISEKILYQIKPKQDEEPIHG